MKKFLFFFIIAMLPGILAGQIYDIRDFGAVVNDGKSDAEAVRQAIERCSLNGGRIIFPPGRYLTGMITLRSHVSIELMKGAKWMAIPDLELYPQLAFDKQNARYAFIFAENATDISITGEGKIYGSGDAHDVFIPAPGHMKKGPRPYGLLFRDCSDIDISGIRLENSAFWMLRMDRCDDVRISGIQIYNHANFNNDGLDMVDCHRVVISDCILDCEDDAICLKSDVERGTKDVCVTNCIISSHASAIKCGTASYGAFRRIVISNCVIRPSRARETLHPIQLVNGLAGIDLNNTDGAVMSDIVISNIVMEGVETPLFIRLGNRNRIYDPGIENAGMPGRTGKTKNISISGIRATNTGPVSSSISGFPGHYIENIRLSGLDFHIDKAGSAGDTLGTVPENSSGYPMSRMFGINLPSYGLYLRHVRDIVIDRVSFHAEEYDPRYEMVAEDVDGLVISGVRNQHPARDIPWIRMKNVLSAELPDKKALRSFVPAGPGEHE